MARCETPIVIQPLSEPLCPERLPSGTIRWTTWLQPQRPQDHVTILRRPGAYDEGTPMPTEFRRRRKHGFNPPSELLADLADLNEDGTARHMDAERLHDLLDKVDAEMDAMAVERAKIHQRERQSNRLLERILAELRRLNAACLSAHREAGRLNCQGQADVRRRQQGQRAKVIIEGQVGRMEVR